MNAATIEYGPVSGDGLARHRAAYPAAPARDVWAAVGEFGQFPMRDGRGYVCGLYVYADGERVAGPYATTEEAEARAARERKLTLGRVQIITGHVFTRSGRVMKESRA